MCKITINMIILLLSLLIIDVKGFTQALDPDYDSRETAVDPFEEDDMAMKKNKIDNIIRRISLGDKTVLRLILYDTFEAVHDQIAKDATEQGKRYYDVIGGQNSVSAFIGGFDNQDPKVRLKCIGYLGDWVDEIGGGMKMIEKAVDRSLATNLESRKEVRYGYRVLKMKLVRRRVISALKKGDRKILVRISPEEFLPLVFYEPRIRTIYLGSPGVVKIRSIVLDPGVVPETGNFSGIRGGRAEGLDIERVCYQGVQEVGDFGEVAQWLEDVKIRGSIEEGAKVGGYVGGGNIGTTRTGSEIQGKAQLDWECVKSIFTGIDNKSLFVREHSARIFLNYIRGYTGNPNYRGNVSGESRNIQKELVKMAKNPYYVRLAQVAWDNVKWSEYYYNDRFTDGENFLSFIQHKHYLEYEYQQGADGYSSKTSDQRGMYIPVMTKRYFTEDVKTYPEWGTEVTGNYRNDVKEVLRILGLDWYIDAEYVFEDNTQFNIGRSRVDTLFNDKDNMERPNQPDRSDRLEGEQ